MSLWGRRARRAHGSVVSSLTGWTFGMVAMRRDADTWFALLVAPFFTLIFLSIVVHADRLELVPHAVIAPTLMTAWAAVLALAGEMISEDRENGRLESLVATPVSFSGLLFGRLAASATLLVPAFALSALVAGLGFGHWFRVHHVLLFLVALVMAGLATAATATGLAALFIAAPGARIVQNSLTYPVFLLGGVMVPADQLPDGLREFSHIVYLSWVADLLRDAATPGPPEAPLVRLAVVLLLTAAALAMGTASIVRHLRLAREGGTLSRI